MAFDREADPVSTDLLILQKARDRVTAGWCTGALTDDYGNVCLLGALGVTEDSELNYVVSASVGWALRALGFDSATDAWDFNDGSDQDDVVARFDAAIDRLSR